MNTIALNYIKIQGMKDTLLKLFNQLKDVELWIIQSQGWPKIFSGMKAKTLTIALLNKFYDFVTN